jgi:hypothetical protein
MGKVNNKGKTETYELDTKTTDEKDLGTGEEERKSWRETG